MAGDSEAPRRSIQIAAQSGITQRWPGNEDRCSAHSRSTAAVTYRGIRRHRSFQSSGPVISVISNLGDLGGVRGAVGSWRQWLGTCSLRTHASSRKPSRPAPVRLGIPTRRSCDGGGEQLHVVPLALPGRADGNATTIAPMLGRAPRCRWRLPASDQDTVHWSSSASEATGASHQRTCGDAATTSAASCSASTTTGEDARTSSPCGGYQYMAAPTEMSNAASSRSGVGSANGVARIRHATTSGGMTSGYSRP